jgi:DNA (cytosine-5)-methyltransferase 1
MAHQKRILKKKTHLDLFSGIGGFALAAQAVGYTTVGFSEIDPFACAVLKRHWPDVPNHGDIRNVRNVRAELVTGGFPCQPFSHAGKRRGAADDRHLWPEMCRVIDESKATLVVAENVPGIIRMELDHVLADLESLGYACWPLVIPACAVDAKHCRDRVWIIAKRIVAHAESCESRQSSQRQGGSCFGGRSSNCDGATDSWCETDGLREGLESFHRWPAEPAVGRVAHGIPHRTHRLRALGNAIVPQVAEKILKAMMKSESHS